jgi:hypothetical protein
LLFNSLYFHSAFLNFLTDAWKINKIELLPKVRKPDGTAHPLLGNKTIVFTNASVLLTQSNGRLVLGMDKFLMPQ